MKITLAIPPALNALYRRNPKTHGLYKTFEGRAFEQQTYMLTKNLPRVSGKVRLDIWFYFQDNRRDIDSGIKILLDALQPVYGNDKCIVEMHIYKRTDPKYPRTEVEITEVVD